jgi:hypothetical protein
MVKRDGKFWGSSFGRELGILGWRYSVKISGAVVLEGNR